MFGRKNLRGLNIPFFLLSVPVILFFAIIKLYFGSLDISYFPLSLLACLTGVQNGIGNGIGCQALWFVYTLFLCKVMANVIKNKWLFQFFISLLCLIIAVIMHQYDFQLYSAYAAVSLAYPFFAVGYYISHKCKNRLMLMTSFPFPKWILIPFILMSSLGLYIIAFYNSMVQMYQADYGNSVVLCIIGGLWGTVFLAVIGMLFRNIDFNHIISTHSKGSIITLAWQVVFLFLIDLVAKKFDITFIHDDGFTLLLSVLIFMAFVPIINFVQRNIPILTGYRK